MYASDYRNDARISATEMLEEIPETIKSDNTETLANVLHQIENLEADKAELLEALENIVKYGGIANFDTLKSLIQKHK